MPTLSTLRTSLRSLGRSPTFTVAAMITLGLGMGASAAIYTLIQRVVLDPLPYPHAERLVRLENLVPGVGDGERWQLSLAQYFHYGKRIRGLERIGLHRTDGMNFSNTGEPQRVRVAIVSASMNDLLGVRPALGRLITDEDNRPGAAEVAVLSQEFWHRAFGADPSVVGTSIRLDEHPVQVVGVMAADVELPADRGATAQPATDLWVPMRLNPAGPFYNNHVFPAVARLAPGATVESVAGELASVLPELPREFPDAYSEQFFKRYGFHTEAVPLKAYVIGDVAKRLWILFGAVWIVLAIACANAANLMLVRLEGRRREIAIRTALGAGWRALAGDALREGALLAIGGAIIAVIVGVVGTRWLVFLAPPGIPRLAQVALDGRTLAFVLGVAALVALAVAVIPALQLRVAPRLTSLGDGGRAGTASVDRRRVRQALVVSQVSLALVLVVSAGLLFRSFAQLRHVDAGIRPQGVVTVELFLPQSRYDSLNKAWRFYDDVLTRLRAVPGVTSAGLGEDVPLAGGAGYGCTVQGFEDKVVYDRVKAAGQTTCAGQLSVSPGYFEGLGIPLIAGRTFTAADNEYPATGAAVVSKTFAQRFWPGENPIGKGLGANGQTEGNFYHVVGVVGDVHARSVDAPPEIAVYYPVVSIPGNWPWYPSSMNLVVRTSVGNPMSLLPVIRRAVSEVDPAIPLANAVPMEEVVVRSMGRVAFTMMLLGIAGGVALALAAVGLYGLVSYVVGRRTNELGVRLALGAQPRQVEGLVVREALYLTAAGVGGGVVGAFLFTRVLRGLLYGVATWDPVSYVGAASVLGIVALAAAWLPARRAARVDPNVALRQE